MKTNIGHLEAAAGVAGLIKVALMLRHGSMVPSLHAGEPNAQIPFETLPLRLLDGPEPWPVGAVPNVAGVSSFGFGGTNVHLVVESAPATIPARDADVLEEDILLPLSARSPEALRELARAMRHLLRDEVALADVARCAALRRDHHDHRLAIVAESSASAVEALDAFLAGTPDPRLAAGRRPPGRRPRLAFVFSGQGGLWWGAGRDLIGREPVFGEVFEACDSAAVPLLADLSGPEADRLADPELAQTCQFALQASLAALLRSWGIAPDAVVGHSLGEVAAAHAAGAIGLEDALRIVSLRGRLMRSVAGRGGTAALGISDREARRRMAPYDALAIAAINGPEMTTVSGESGPLRELVATLGSEGRFARLLDVDCPFHHPILDPLRIEMAEALSGLEPRGVSTPMISTVTGRAVSGDDLDGTYWSRNLRETVNFADAIARLGDDDFDVFLEIGPHPIHRGAIAETLGSRSPRPAVVATLHRDGDGRADLLRAVARLYVQGCPVAWDRLAPAGRFVPLPTYPWQGKRHWIDEETPLRPKASLNGHHASNDHHDGNGHVHDGAAEAPHAADDLFYEIRWSPTDGSATGVDIAGRWLVVGEGGTLARSLADDLERRGAEVLVEPMPAAESLRGSRRVVYVAPTGHDVEATATRTCADVLRLIGALALHPGPVRPRLWVVTQGAQPAGEASRPLAVGHSSVWGLGRSLALEHPEIWGGLVDLGPDQPEKDDVETLARRSPRAATTSSRSAPGAGTSRD